MQENETKILLLQLRKHRNRFLSIIKSDLLKKGSSNADTASRKIKTQIQKDMKTIGWDYVPRAKLSASLHFHSNSTYIPELPKLVKYLLDILCVTICNDDKQIRHLAACCIRPSDKKQKANDNSIFIEVERLTDYKQKFKLFTKLMRIDEFREYFRYRNYNDIFNDEDDKRIEDLWPDEETAELLKLPSDTVKQWHRMTIQNNQQKLLSINTLDTSDWPEGPKDFLFAIKNDCNDLNPFIFRIDGFPTKKGRSKYKTRLRQKLKELNVKFPLFGKIIAPLELDIQVSPKNNYLIKDLDNIILEIDDVFSDELLEKGSYLHGYRIYRVKEPQTPSMDSLRFKLLPMYEINKFQGKIDATLAMGIEWLEERMW